MYVEIMCVQCIVQCLYIIGVNKWQFVGTFNTLNFLDSSVKSKVSLGTKLQENSGQDSNAEEGVSNCLPWALSQP